MMLSHQYRFNYVALLLLSSFCAFSQEKAIPEPDFVGRPYFLDSANNSLIPMERVDGEIVYKSKALGFGGGDGYVVCNGSKSSVRIQKGIMPTVIIKVSENQDPEDYLFLAIASIKKDKRNFLVAKKAALSEVKETTDGRIALTFKKIGKDLYKITTPNDLHPGEYAFIGGGDSVKGVIKIPCFGVND